ncbi:MAG: hypothetical protein QY306_01755 [Anaerolineales bacterium]|nr:MAG: hypothetical protein QY306_01755 [Anaerolineales bacterium]
MAIKLENAEKVEILRQVLPQFWNEAVHWREDSWRFTTWLVSAFIVIAGASVYTDKGKIFAALILLALSWGGTKYLQKNYRSYQDRIRLFVQVEEALLFFEDDIYIKGRSLLPRILLEPKVTSLGQNTYIVIIWVVAIASWASLAFQALQR